MRLTIKKCDGMGDWYIIERAEHDGRSWMEKTGPSSAALCLSSRFSDADVEGRGVEMLAIAEAVEKGGSAHFKRCAVNIGEGEAEFWSPRNSQKSGFVSLAEAIELAALIRRTVTSPAAEASAP